MSPNSHDQDHLILKTDFCIQSIFITFQIKDDSVVGQKARMRVTCFDVTGCLPLGLFNFTDPGVKLPSHICVRPGEPLQAVSTHNSHENSCKNLNRPHSGNVAYVPMQ